MKKTLLFVCAGVLLAPQAFAQKTKLQRALRGPLTEQQDALLQSVLRLAQRATAGKTTAQMQRLIGYGINSVSGGGLTDSARLFYNSQARGSNHGTNDLSSYYFSYDPTTEYQQPIENLFDLGPLRIKCDSAVLSDVSGVYQRSGLTYNAATQPTSFRSNYFFNGASGGRERYTMTYNGSGQRTQLFYEVDTVASGGTGTFLPDFRMYTTFGGTPARALRDSTVPAANAPYTTTPTRVVYSYTGNNLTSVDEFEYNGATYDTVQRTQMAYDSAGRVTKVNFYVGFGSGLTLLVRDSLTYTGSYPFYTGSYFFFNIGTGLELALTGIYTVNAQGLRDTLRTYDNQTNTQVGLAVYQYNSYGNPDSYRYFDYAANTTTPDETGRYYYELHDPTSVAKVPTPTLQATAYPNPVRNTLALTWQRGEGAVNIHVTDASGRVLESLHLPASAAAHMLDMSRYATGTYFVTLNGSTGATQHLKVAKQ